MERKFLNRSIYFQKEYIFTNQKWIFGVFNNTIITANLSFKLRISYIK